MWIPSHLQKWRSPISMTNKCDNPWPLMTKFCDKIVVFSYLSVTPICHHVAKNFWHDFWVCHYQFQLLTAATIPWYPSFWHWQSSVQYFPWVTASVIPGLFPDLLIFPIPRHSTTFPSNVINNKPIRKIWHLAEKKCIQFHCNQSYWRWITEQIHK